MRTTVFLALAILILLLILLPRLTGQEAETATFTVRGTEVVTGVVIISGQAISTTGSRTSVELQCNKGMSMCKALSPGTYVMVRLPKNHGSYDCANVDVYQQGADPAVSAKIGEYCLMQK